MKINEAWLRDWADIDGDPAALAEQLTLAGLEVDGIESAGGPLDEVVVARIEEAVQHPDADRLKVCTVTDGTVARQVVCGAPNARAGLITAFARPAACLPGGVVVKAAEIRGVASAGMLCSAAELGLGDDSDGIIELPAESKLGQALNDCLGLDDHIFDISLTPNQIGRAHV